MSMSTMKDEMNMDLIEQLRGLTEEIDFNQFLNKKFGGYTKKSVLDYLSMLRKQQQSASDTFYKHLQMLFAEKENLQSTNKKLMAHMQKVESEYQNLSEVVKIYHSDNEELTLSNLVSLKNMVTAKEEELKKVQYDNRSLESKIEQLDQINQDLGKNAEQTAKENTSQKELIITLKQELKKHLDIITDLSAQLEVERDENKYLKGKISESEAAQLTQKINELTDQFALQSELIAIKNEEVIQKDKNILSLSQEVETLKKSTNELSSVLDEINAQNDRLIDTNQSLTKVLEEEFVNTIALIREKSEVNRERISAVKKLDEAKSKISILELQIDKSSKVIELNKVNQHAAIVQEEKKTENCI